MARFSKREVLNVMHSTGMVPLFYHADTEVAKQVLKAIYKGGARLLEFTNRGDFAHEVFTDLIKFAEVELPELIMGVGSVVDAGTAAMYMQCGANFIVTPVLREDIAKACNRRQVLWSAGCGSLKEMTDAEELGCPLVKLFPAGTYGPKFIKAVRAPQPWTQIMPTGGVSPDKENLQSWFDAGAYCVGMGSKLMAKNEDGSFNYQIIEERTSQALGHIKDIKAS